MEHLCYSFMMGLLLGLAIIEEDIFHCIVKKM